MKNIYRVLDLFSGAGGLSYGLEKTGYFKSLIALDFNEPAIETFKKNHEDTKCIVGDITDKKVKDKIIKLSKKDKINMIVGGPPCQGFSNKGKNLGLKDERNFLFLEYVDLVKEIEPEIFIIENVKNMVSSANGYFINEIVKLFTEIGYLVNYKIINSYEFGVPQTRERTIVIGSRNFKYDFKNLYKYTVKEEKRPKVHDAISDLNYLNSGEGSDVSEYLIKSSSNYQKEMRKNSKKLYNHIATNHSEIAINKLKMIPAEKGKEFLPIELHGKQKFKTTWSRLEWNKPSPTIDTRFDTPSNGKNSHPVLNRAITPREAARLQSFPDKYRFYGKKTEICKQIGNAVPPLLAEKIGLSLIEQIARCKTGHK
ncbi:DNA cytosine methyltransferase [Leptotrichia sp. HSP-536]|uniref:Cytosine-specific methyltransferase n=1 Tax=Leptotrichia alba TaxID=3239304 RepID=A0AB39V2U7_9FUSO